jgi:rhodanese-related sulfurtransferase
LRLSVIDVSLYWKHRADRVVPRVQVAALAAKLQAEGPGKILLADVRSHGYYAAGAVRIPGSIRIEPNNLSAEIKNSPRQRHVPVLHLPERSDQR